MDRSLTVRCATWEQVETFVERKLKQSNALQARVPFVVKRGMTMTIALELPNELVVAFDGTVEAARLANDGKRHAVLLRLDVDDKLRERLRALVEDGKAENAVADVEPVARITHPPPARSSKNVAVEPPAPEPPDAPIDELVVAEAPPDRSTLLGDQLDVYVALEAKLFECRERAAHEVLGVSWDADVPSVRRAYFVLTKKFHPDLYARHDSAAIRFIASEVFISINRAYDRMRDAAVAAGKAIVAGPALLPHQGWIAGADDVGSQRLAKPLDKSSVAKPAAPTRRSGVRFAQKPPTMAPSASPAPPPRVVRTRAPSQLDAELLFDDVGTDDGESSASNPIAPAPAAAEPDIDLAMVSAGVDVLLGEGKFTEARSELANLLGDHPRNRKLRALYHVATGVQLEASDHRAEATTQFEAALAHDPECSPASEALRELRRGVGKKGVLFRRLFQR